MSRLGDFKKPTIEALARRAGYVCSLDGRATVGPATDPTAAVSTGRAAHIVAAAPTGPRGDSSVSMDERRSISNGIWLCADCADLVDKDITQFPEHVLRAYKVEAERRARAKLMAQPPTIRTVPRGPTEWSDEVADVLQKLYPNYPLTRLYGERLATWAIPASPSQMDRPDSVLGQLESELESENPYETHDYDYRTRWLYEDLLARPETNLHFNGALYAMTSLTRKDGEIKIHCRPGRYFEARATSWELRQELLQAIHDRGCSVASEDLILRSRINGKAARNGRRRCAEVAVSTVLFLEGSDGTWQVVVAPRSASTGTEPLVYHVAPAGKLAPVSSAAPAWRKDFSVRRTVYRELLEECLGYREFSGAQWEGDNDLGDLPEIGLLEAAVARGAAKFILTGVCVNLLNLLPEICTALFIRDASWWLENLTLNEEFAAHEADLHAGYRLLQRIPLESGFRLSDADIAHLRPDRWVQVGATALKLALDAAPTVFS